MIVIYYHRQDLDGMCSGEIVRRHHPEAKLVGVNYNEPFDNSIISKGDTVYVVDFSFTYEEMLWLNNNCELTWIDHHRSAMENLNDLNFRGLRRIGTAACLLCWEYLYPNRPIPYFVKLLSDYDVWNHKNPDVLAFQYGIRLHENTRPGSSIWTDYFNDSSDWALEKTAVQKTIANGQLILEYETAQNAKYAASMAYEAEFESYRAIVINKPFSNSKIFDSVYDSDKHDIMIIFGCKEPGTPYKYSLYCNKPEIDVSKLAVKYGGGGHKGAAGFYTDLRVA